jgi:hypothetical protein
LRTNVTASLRSDNDNNRTEKELYYISICVCELCTLANGNPIPRNEFYISIIFSVDLAQ